MGVRQQFANLVTGGEFSRLQKGYQSLLDGRPLLAPVEQANRGRNRPYLALAFFFELEVSFFADCVHKLQQEIFRNGTAIEPKFALKCNYCGNELTEKEAKCPVCQSTDLREANPAQLFMWRREDGLTFEQRANYNDQTMIQVLKQVEFNLDVADNGLLFCRFQYMFDEVGKIVDRIPREFIPLDPRWTEKMVDETGLWLPDHKACPEHRSTFHKDSEKRCRQCGKDLKQVGWRSVAMGSKAESTVYFFTDEICHSTKYSNNLIYGYPAIFKLMDTVYAYHYLEKRVRLFYERGRPSGFVTIPTNNLASTESVWKKNQVEMQKDPFYTPWLNFDPNARVGMQYLKLMDDPSPQMLEVKKDLRERVGSFFGVSPIFQGDTSQSGGLNNEGLQMTVTNRAMQDGQTTIHKFMAFIFTCVGITDWDYKLVPNEEKDEMAELQKFSLEVDIMLKMQQAGWTPEYHDVKSGQRFTYTGAAKAPGMGMGGMNMPGMDQQQPPLDMGQGQPENQGTPQEFDLDQFKQEAAPAMTPDGQVDLDKLNALAGV